MLPVFLFLFLDSGKFRNMYRVLILEGFRECRYCAVNLCHFYQRIQIVRFYFMPFLLVNPDTVLLFYAIFENPDDAFTWMDQVRSDQSGWMTFHQ